MYKFSVNEDEDKQNRQEAVDDASDPAATPATPQAPQSVQDMLKSRIASQLDPSLQQRYKDRQAQAVAQQNENYQGPEAIQALKDGQDFRNLQTGLQSAANKFGSVGGDGGQKSDFASIAKGFDDSAKQQYALKDDAFKAGQANEDKAVDEGFKNGVARPLALQEGVNTLNNSDREAKQNAILDPLKVDNARTANAASKLDFKNKDALNDASSPESAQLREFAKQYPQLNVTDATTGAQLNSLIPLVQHKYQLDEQISARKASDAERAAGRRESTDARLEAARISAEAKAANKTEKEPNKEQFEAGGFSKRMEQAEAIFDGLEKGGFDRTSKGSGFQSILPSSMQSADVQQQEQAERNFVNSVLRRESGAAISPSEFDSAAKQYFPRAGDTPEVAANKKANRQQAIASIKAASGNAYNKIPDVSAQPKAESSSPSSVPVHGKDLP